MPGDKMYKGTGKKSTMKKAKSVAKKTTSDEFGYYKRAVNKPKKKTASKAKKGNPHY